MTLFAVDVIYVKVLLSYVVFGVVFVMYIYIQCEIAMRITINSFDRYY